MKLRMIGLLATLAVAAGCSSSDDIDAVNVPNSVAIADVNGDGSADLLVATTADQGNATNPGFASVILANTSSPGTFQRGVRYNTTGDSPSSIAVGDIASRGAKDLVIANFAAGSASVFMQDAATAGRYQVAVDVRTGGLPNEVLIGDVNSDGKPDLVLADLSNNGNVITVLQDAASTGRFLAPVNLSIGAPTAGVAVGDIDGDGRADIVAANFDVNGNNGRVSVFVQNPASPGSFLTRADFPAGAQPQSVKIADIDSDGLVDLAVANFGAGSDGVGSSGTSVLLQDPSNPGSFLAPVTYAAQGGSVNVVITDVNADGRLDLVVSNLGPSPIGSVSVLLQDPTRAGIFLVATSYGGFGLPLGVATGDLNGDGRVDIAVADGNSASVMLQSATSPGVFGGATLVGN